MNIILIYLLISLTILLLIISLLTYKKLNIKFNIKENKIVIVVIALIIIGLLTIIPFIYFVFNNSFWADELKDKGEIGDFIGGLSAPIINLVSAVLVYYAFTEQKRANDLLQDSLNTKRNLYLNLQLEFYKRKKAECEYFIHEMNIIRDILKNKTKSIDYKHNYYGGLFLGEKFTSFSEAIVLTDSNENYFTCFDKTDYPAYRVVNLNKGINTLINLNLEYQMNNNVFRVNDANDGSEAYNDSTYLPLGEELDRIIELLEEIESECEKIIRHYS